MAHYFDVMEQAIKQRMTKLFRKYGVRNRVELVQQVRELDLPQIPVKKISFRQDAFPPGMGAQFGQMTKAQQKSVWMQIAQDAEEIALRTGQPNRLEAYLRGA